MSGPFGSSQWMYATGTAVEGQSLRFNDDDNAYLSWTPAAAGNRKTWTWSGWVKRGNLPSSDVYLFGNSNGSNQGFHVRFDSSDTLTFLNYPSSASGHLTTSRVFRDTSAWYHIVLVWDTTDATSGDRMRMYINGERETAFGTASYPSLNLDGTWNSTSYGDHAIGRNNYNGRYFDGYMAEVNFVDGTALDPTSFGETDANGQWVPITSPSVTYGTNGFYLPFTNDYEVEGFNTVTYRGNGGEQYVGGVGFDPDFLWIKRREGADNHILQDSVRGAAKQLFSNLTDAELSGANNVQSFETDGFVVGTDSGSNGSGRSFVAWAWDAGTGSAASNTDGTITSSVKANQDYGFSIVSYDSNPTGTVGHGLSQTPKLIIEKKRDASADWLVGHTLVDGSYDYLRLNTTAANANSAVAAPTSTVFTPNATSNSMIAYCFADVTGYQKIGTYTGTGSAGNAITGLGFKPAWIMIKKTDSIEDWCIYDNTRNPGASTDTRLEANDNAAEVSASSIEITFDSDGFTANGTNSSINTSGGTYLYLAIADTRDAAFWLDQSGNNNDWTNNNMQESDISLDNPTNNFATFNVLNKYSGITLSEGNLTSLGADAAWRNVDSTIHMSSGKWYWEVHINNITSFQMHGILPSVRANGRTDFNSDVYVGSYSDEWGYRENGYLYNSASPTTGWGSTYTTGDVLGFSLDMDAGTLDVTKNGVSTGSQITGISGTYRTCATLYGSSSKATYNFGQDSSFAGNKVAQGNTDENGFGDFYYEPPAGYLALCTQNLPDPAINDGTEHFNTALWTGTGASNSITGVGFQPDLVWTKDRGVATTAHTLNNVVSGVDKYLVPSRTSAEATLATLMTSFDSDGFTLGTHGLANYSGRTYVGWSWKAGGTGVANTDGTISSTVSANQTAGFSVVSYTGNGTIGATIGHGLNQTPEFVITKNRDAATNWPIWTSLTGSYTLYLNFKYSSKSGH